MILASQSPRRIEILQLAGYNPDVQPQDVDETPLAGESPVELVERLSRRKALACAVDAPPDEVIIAADTIVWMGDEELGKPADSEDARRMLGLLSGKTHHVGGRGFKSLTSRQNFPRLPSGRRFRLHSGSGRMHEQGTHA